MKLCFVTSLSALLLSACTSPDPVVDGTLDRASLRAIHLATGAPPVDLFVGGASAPSYRGLAYGAISPYLDLPAGRNQIDVASGGQRITTLEVNVEAQRFYTAVVLDDRTLTFDGAGEGIRVVHAAPEVGALDVWDLMSGERLSTGLSYGQSALVPKTARIGFDADGDATPDLTFQIPAGSGVIEAFAVGDAEQVIVKSYYQDGSAKDCMPEPKAPAQIRVLHLSPDAPNVDVYAGDTRAVADLAFARSTAFLELPSGDYTFGVTAAGDPNPVLSVDLTLAPEGAYTAVAFGPLASIGALAIPEILTPPASGIRIRVVHAAFGVGQVDVINQGSGELLVDDTHFGDVSPALIAPAGTHTLGLDLDDDANAELIFELPELIEGASANIFAVADQAGAFLLVQLLDGTTIRVAPSAPPEPKTAFLRAVHLSPDAPAVNAFVGGDPEAAIAGLMFKQATGTLEIEAGDVRLDVSAGTIEESILSVAALPLAEEASYTVAVFDRVHAVQALALEDDLSAPPAGMIRIRAIHTAVGVGNVNILAGSDVLYADLPFGSAGDAIELGSGAYTVGLDVDDDHVADLLFDLPHLAAGTIANVFAVTDAHGVPTLFAQLADGATADVSAR